jgi:hypothetical protein
MTALRAPFAVHASYPLAVVLALALGTACGHAQSPSNACPDPPGSLHACDVGLGSEGVGVVLEHPDVLVGQTMVVRGVLIQEESALFLAEPAEGSERIAVRLRSACPVDAHKQSVLVRGIFRTHGEGSYMLDSARVCVP